MNVAELFRQRTQQGVAGGRGQREGVPSGDSQLLEAGARGPDGVPHFGALVGELPRDGVVQRSGFGTGRHLRGQGAPGQRRPALSQLSVVFCRLAKAVVSERLRRFTQERGVERPQ